MADSGWESCNTAVSKTMGVSDFVSQRFWATAYPSGQFLVILRFSARRPTISLAGMQPRRTGRLPSLGVLHVSLSTSLLLAGLGMANSVCVRVEIDQVRGYGSPTVRAALGTRGHRTALASRSLILISRRFHAGRPARIPALLPGLQAVSVGGRQASGRAIWTDWAAGIS